MKNYIAILLVLFLGCREDFSSNSAKHENCSTPARMKNLTGLDGCGYMLELNDGKRLNPMCRYNPNFDSAAKSQSIEYVDGKLVFIDYKVCDDVYDNCMAGQNVEITCMREADPIPSCIQEKIEEIKKEPVWGPPAKVYRYTYNGKKVYFIPQHCCDIPSILMNESCQTICSPDGGLSGGGDGKCTDFFDKRTNEELVWKDER